jgi:pimeloyl-ACP methyl ester carboxylesterase
MKLKVIFKTLAKNLKGIMLTILGLVLVCILIVTGILWVYSPGTQEPYRDQTGNLLAGSLSEKVFVTIGGVKMGMFIESKDTRHPVLLYLHGGLPEYFLTQKYPTGLENYFTVVWWEQRGSGISYDADIPPETITSEQMISDTKEVTNYLLKRFGQEKIYLMAHSGGTFTGIQTAAQHPELFHAYIGVAQISDQLKSEKLAYDYMLKRYKVSKNIKMVQTLESSPVLDGTSIAYLKLRDKAMHELGIGTTRDMNSIVTDIFLPSLTCKAYTFGEKIHMWRGKSKSGVASLWNEMLVTNLMQEIPKLEVPVYFFSGIYDYTVSYALAKEYCRRLEAPIKGFYTFKESAHSPIFEEPEKVQWILRDDVLRGLNNMAD